MSNPIDLEAWQQVLADRHFAEEAQRRFEQHRFTIAEHDRHAAAASIQFQASEVAARLESLRAVAEERRLHLDQRLADLVEQRAQIQARAARGQGAATRLNKANRTLQTHIGDCAVQLNALAKLLNAEHPDDIVALDEDAAAFFSAPMVLPMWTGSAEVALPRTVAIAGVAAAIASFLPWFASSSALGATNLWRGIAGDATSNPAYVLGYAGIVLPLLLAAVALSTLRFRPWVFIASALAVTFVWIGLCYVRITTTVPWWSMDEMFGAMRAGAWIYSAAALAGLIATCYYAQGEGNTVQRSLRTAGWLVVLFVLPGLLAAGMLALRPGPPPVTVGVSTVADHPDSLLLTITNNTDSAIDVSLPWSSETVYGVRVEIKLRGADMFRRVEETSNCWRAPVNDERPVNRLSISPSLAEPIRFDIGCIRAMGYSPVRLRFSLANADGHTVKAYQAIIPE
jgi:hypothetical protein